jgi:hypothetical protein
MLGAALTGCWINPLLDGPMHREDTIVYAEIDGPVVQSSERSDAP